MNVIPLKLPSDNTTITGPRFGASETLSEAARGTSAVLGLGTPGGLMATI